MESDSARVAERGGAGVPVRRRQHSEYVLRIGSV
jgi:hypothetical protein